LKSSFDVTVLDEPIKVDLAPYVEKGKVLGLIHVTRDVFSSEKSKGAARKYGTK
jgi:hypothetical protein